MKILKKGIAVALAVMLLLSTFVFSTSILAGALTFTPKLGCYNSTESSSLTTGTTTANKYVSTQIFTREDLPNGTEIKIDRGYKYRPEGWVSLDQKNESRPSQVYGYSTVTVDDEWWGDYNYRAFNISKSNEVDISSSYMEVASHFTITLPDEIEEKTVRVLAIGNSYSNDAFHYAEEIAAKFGIKAEFWSLYQSGCYISKHLDNFNNKTAAYTIYRNGEQVRGSVTMNQILDECNFDYITLQQGSARSNKWSYYYTESNPYIVDLYNKIKAEQPKAKFLIHQTWGYSPAEAQANGHSSSLDHFTAIENCYNKASELLDLPLAKSGKAIQLVKDYGFLTDDRGGENSVYADEYCHLTNRGDFIAGCVLVETIFDVDTTTKDFTSLFADAKNLCKVAHSAVTGEPIEEDPEDIYYEPKRTMFRYKKSDGWSKCLYKLPTKLEANTEYTITIATKFVTGSLNSSNLIFALYGIDDKLYEGNETNNAMNEASSLLRSSDTSSTQFTSVNNKSYNNYKVYSFSLTEEEAANKNFYLGYSFNRAAGVEFYISEFSLYKSSDETKKSLLNIDDYSTDVEGWVGPYGTATTIGKYVEYDPSLFNYAVHIKYTGTKDNKRIGVMVPSVNNGGVIKKGVKYTISFDYYMLNRGFDYGVYPMLFASSGTSLGDPYYDRIYSKNYNSGSTKTLFGDKVGGVYKSRNGFASYSFTIAESETLRNNYFVGFLMPKNTSWTSNPEFYLSNLKLTAEGSDENLLPVDEYQYSFNGTNSGNKWKENDGFIKNEGKGFDESNYVAYGTGDGNIDGEFDIRDLVAADETITAEGFNPFLDTNVDRTVDKYDLNNIRYRLLGLGVTAPKPGVKPEIPEEPEVPDEPVEPEIPEDVPPYDVIPTGNVTGERTASKTTAQTVQPGEKITYTVELKNNENTEQSAVLYEKLPSGTTLLSGDCENKNGYIAWDGSIGAGEKKIITYTIKVDKDYSLCGTVLESSAMLVNGKAIDGYDLYIERTISSAEDQRFISNGIRAMKDSTYRDLEIVRWAYYVAFTKNGIANMKATSELSINLVLGGTAPKEVLDIVAPTLYGGTAVTGKIDGVKGEPTTKIKTSDLIVGDVLIVKNGDAVNGYIYDKDGFVDLNNPLGAVDTNALLESAVTKTAFMVFRPSIGMPRDYILDEEFEELELSPQQEALIATAESYILRGEKFQYADTRFGGISNTEYRWNTGDRNPEWATNDEWGYINCAGFTYELYNTALGVNLAYGSTKLWSTTRLADNASNAGIQAYRFTRSATTVEDEATRERIKNEVLSTIQPGDLMVVIRSGSNSGHVVLYIGNGTFIHSTGGVYDYSDVGEKYEATIRYNRVEDYFFTEGSGGYIFRDSTKDDNSQVIKFVVVRPLKSANYNVAVPQETQNRINNLQGIMAQKLSSHNSTTTANRGEEVTFTFELYNTNDTAKTVEVRDTVPANTTYVSGADNKNGDTLSWNVTIPANTRVTVSYTVEVNSDAVYGDYVQTTDTSTVGGVRVICPKVYINRTLTKAEQDKVVEAFNTLKANGTTKTGLALINEIYKTAGISDMVFEDTDFATVMEGAEGTFKVVAQEGGNDYYQLTDKGTKYRDMMVETLYGGRRYYGFSGDARTDRSRLPRKHNIMVGDVLVRRISNGTYYAYLYIGGDYFINITSGIATESTTVSRRLELLLCVARYYAVYRPSFSIK